MILNELLQYLIQATLINYDKKLQFIQLVVKNMAQVIPPLNVFIAFFYVVCSGLALFFYKKAVKPLTRLSKSSQKQLQELSKPNINYDKLLVVSWLKKYTLIGSCFSKDKKFLLKQFVFIGLYAVTCLHINHMIIWPIALSIAVLIISFITLQIVVSRFQQEAVGEKNTNKVTTNQVHSEMEIETVNIQTKNKQVKSAEEAKVDAKKPRSLAELITITCFCFVSIVMMLLTMLTLAKSLSNSGQLNITSVLIIIALDQFALRPACGGLTWLTYKLVCFVIKINPEQFQLVQLLCSQEVTSILVQSQKARIKKLGEMTASPPKKKTESPSKVPKAFALNADGPTYLNLISLQPTKRQNQIQDQQIQNIYLTTAQKELFEGKDTIQNKSGLQTRRKANKENKEIYSFSAAQKCTTIDVNENHDLILIRDDPLHELQNNHIDEFYLEQNEGTTRRKCGGYKKKKNKRNLKLTGSSPYLEYLPDMLKKVDKYKHDHPKKENEDIRRSKKLL